MRILGYGDKSLALPYVVYQSLKSESVPAKDLSSLKLQLLTIENVSVVIRGILRIMIELIGLISRENMRQRAQQIIVVSPFRLSGS